MIKYGLISETDARTLEKTIDLILEDFRVDDIVNITEVGVYGGDTGYGMTEYINERNRDWVLTGIENNKDGETIRATYDKLIIGNSNEVYNQLEDNSQHLIFVDGCHCFAHVVSDFFCYASKVKAGGYFAFHDTGRHIKPFKDFQHGDKSNPDAYISVRKALLEIGMFLPISNFGFNLQFDKADETNEAGGICVFKKIY
jgi:hypothetical protein